MAVDGTGVEKYRPRGYEREGAGSPDSGGGGGGTGSGGGQGVGWEGDVGFDCWSLDDGGRGVCFGFFRCLSGLVDYTAGG